MINITMKKMGCNNPVWLIKQTSRPIGNRGLINYSKKSVAKKQIVQAKKGTKYCQSSFEIFSSIVNRFANNPIVLGEYDQLKSE